MKNKKIYTGIAIIGLISNLYSADYNSSRITQSSIASAIKNNDFAPIESLLTQYPSAVNDMEVVIELGAVDTLLSLAVKANNVRITKLLLESGANPNIPNQRYSLRSATHFTTPGNYVLNIAIQNNNPEMVRLLLKAGANPFNKGAGGGEGESKNAFETALMADSSQEIITLLNEAVAKHDHAVAS